MSSAMQCWVAFLYSTYLHIGYITFIYTHPSLRHRQKITCIGVLSNTVTNYEIVSTQMWLDEADIVCRMSSVYALANQQYPLYR